MAPNTTGHGATDHLRIVALAEAAVAFALEVLAEGGGFVAKVFQGGAERTVLEALKRHFSSVRHAKPPASRKEVFRTVCGGYGVSGWCVGRWVYFAVDRHAQVRPLAGGGVSDSEKMEPRNTFAPIANPVG